MVSRKPMASSLKLFFLAAVAAFVGCSSAQQKSIVQSSALPHTVVRKNLANGMTLVLVEDHTIPIVSYQSWFLVGSVDEVEGKSGLAHLFEHLMFKGTPSYGPRQFFEQLELKGAEVNAFTARDHTAYYVNASPSLLPKIIEMESDRLANLYVTADEFARERQVVFEERHLTVDSNPSGKMNEVLWSLVFKTHPYKTPIIGLPVDLVRLSTENANSFFKQHYSPANLTLVIVGDFSSEEVLSWIEAAYGNIPSGTRNVRAIAPEPEQTSERRLVMSDTIASDQFVHGYPIARAGAPDSFALDLAANILCGGTRARANAWLVEKKQLASAVNCSSYTPTFEGVFTIDVVARPGIPAEKLETELNEHVLKSLIESGVTEEELTTAKRKMELDVYHLIRTPYGLGQTIGLMEIILGNGVDYLQDLAHYRAVTREDIQRVMQKYFHPNRRNSVVLKPLEKSSS